jgi:phage shock protein A
MSILSRLKSIIKSKTNTVLDKLENPEEALNLSLTEMKEKIVEIKKAMLEVTTIKKKYENELRSLDDKIKLAQEQAELSIQASRDDLAEKALVKKENLVNQAEKTKIEIEKLEDKLDVITQNKELLENRINEFSRKRSELIALNQAANAQMVAKEIVSGVSSDMDDITARIERAESKIKEKEARIQAMDEIMEREDSSSDDLEKELKEIGKQGKVKKELEALKQKMKKSDE